MFNVEIGYLMVLHVKLGANFGDLRAKDSNAFRKRQILGMLCNVFYQSSSNISHLVAPKTTKN